MPLTSLSDFVAGLALMLPGTDPLRDAGTAIANTTAPIEQPGCLVTRPKADIRRFNVILENGQTFMVMVGEVIAEP